MPVAATVRARIGKVAALTILVIGGMAAAGTLWVYCASEWKLGRVREIPLRDLARASGPPNLQEGERLAKILGCWAGCHGAQGAGGSIDMGGYYSVSAPALSSVLPLYSDAELARLVRFGVKRNGTSALGMISYTFYPLGDDELANVIAHLRRQPSQAPVAPKRSITWRARVKLAQGKWQVAADQVDPRRPRWGELPRQTAFERGRYLASITCAECHGVEFRGSEFTDNTYDGGPSLAIVAIYGPDEFRRLLRTGIPIGGRDLGEMSWVARNGFVYFTDQEIEDIRAFLRQYNGVPKG